MRASERLPRSRRRSGQARAGARPRLPRRRRSGCGPGFSWRSPCAASARVSLDHARSLDDAVAETRYGSCDFGETATPLVSLKVGFLLFLVLPGNLICMLTVGAYLAHHGAAWWHGLIFVALTVAPAGLPLLLLLSLGKRAQALLPEARGWMMNNSWIVSEIVIGFFLLMTLKSLLGV
ncbi:MAG TPA: GAP family protein [Thermoanaerobaculia bacterium]|nr:GAP family protein [Thermoanaerobaculia bacterium]